MSKYEDLGNITVWDNKGYGSTLCLNRMCMAHMLIMCICLFVANISSTITLPLEEPVTIGGLACPEVTFSLETLKHLNKYSTGELCLGGSCLVVWCII